jgi:hypothetical protein
VTTTGMPPAIDGALRDFYEDPSVPVSSGSGRAQRQLRMLTALLADADGPQVIVDVGCGDGAATGMVRRLTARGFTCERVDGAPYQDVPLVLRPLDHLLCRWPSAASILLVQARRA